MNYLKDSPVGIDKVVDLIQKGVYDNLLSKWKSLDIHPIAKKRQGNDGIILDAYVGKKEYQPILFSEGNKVFFVQGDSPTINHGTATNELWAICILNIDKIYKTSFMETERAHIDFMDELYRLVDIESIVGIEYGMSNLRRVVEDDFQVGNFKYSDIHPYHVFMVKMNVDYQVLNNNCKK